MEVQRHGKFGYSQDSWRLHLSVYILRRIRFGIRGSRNKQIKYEGIPGKAKNSNDTPTSSGSTSTAYLNIKV
jgi:hypothetical protein